MPGPGERPQTFETVEPIEARPSGTSCGPRLGELEKPAFGDTELFLKGVATNLAPGDAILIVGDERAEDEKAESGISACSTRSTPTRTATSPA